MIADLVLERSFAFSASCSRDNVQLSIPLCRDVHAKDVTVTTPAPFLASPFHSRSHHSIIYEVGLGFICLQSASCKIETKSAREYAYLSLSTSHGDVHETAGVRYSLLCAALGGLLLLLWLDLDTHISLVRVYWCR